MPRSMLPFQVTYTGSRDYQRSFHDERKRFMSSKADQLELCLNLLPITNYSISITALSARFTATITTNTSLPGITAHHYSDRMCSCITVKTFLIFFIDTEHCTINIIHRQCLQHQLPTTENLRLLYQL